MHTITLKSTRPIRSPSGRKAVPEAAQSAYADLAAVIAEGNDKWAALGADAKAYKQRYDAAFQAYQDALSEAGLDPLKGEYPSIDGGAGDYAELGYW